MKARTRTNDLDLQLIANYETAIVKAHDEKIDQGVSAEEVERQRPGVVQLAATIAERMRADLARRQS